VRDGVLQALSTRNRARGGAITFGDLVGKAALEWPILAIMDPDSRAQMIIDEWHGG
jgi:hypothetical protein